MTAGFSLSMVKVSLTCATMNQSGVTQKQTAGVPDAKVQRFRLCFH
jgi:hypothetical protein